MTDHSNGRGLPVPRSLLAFALFSTCALTLPGPGHAGFLFSCGDNTPARPVPEYLEGVRLWPKTFRPARPGQVLPEERDSTARTGGNTVPNASIGHELFKALDFEGDLLFVAYGLGIQVWDVGPGYLERPRRLAVRDLWHPGDFLLPPPDKSEQLHFINDVDALRPSAGGPIVVAAAGKVPFVGPTFWTFEKSSPLKLRYQDGGDGANGGTPALQGSLFELGGRMYYVAAGGSTVTLYDVDAAVGLAEACLDNRGENAACGPVWRGVLPDLRARYVDAIVVGNRVLLALGGMGRGVRLVELPLRSDGSLVPRDAGLLASTGGAFAGPVALFDHGGRSWLGLVDTDRVEVYEITGCVEGTGCVLVEPEWRSEPIPFFSEQFLTFSSNRGVPYLYYGINAHELFGGAIERLYDLRTLGRTNKVRRVADGGGAVYDPCSGGMIDYWSAYYGGNTGGLRGVEPREGKFHRDRFYRVAETIFDVHVLDDPSIFVDGFESGTLLGWSASTP